MFDNVLIMEDNFRSVHLYKHMVIMNETDCQMGVIIIINCNDVNYN